MKCLVVGAGVRSSAGAGGQPSKRYGEVQVVAARSLPTDAASGFVGLRVMSLQADPDVAAQIQTTLSGGQGAFFADLDTFVREFRGRDGSQQSITVSGCDVVCTVDEVEFQLGRLVERPAPVAAAASRADDRAGGNGAAAAPEAVVTRVAGPAPARAAGGIAVAGK